MVLQRDTILLSNWMSITALRVILEGADKARVLVKYFILGLWKHAVFRSWMMNFAFMADK